LDVSRERYSDPDGWEPIPFFQAVYHGYGLFFGSYSSLTSPPYDDLWPAQLAPKQPLELLDRQFSAQFYLEQARSFVWGQQPTLANFRPGHLSERALEVAYVMRLARLRKGALRYLQDGVMLPPPQVVAPSQELPMSRLSIYAGQQGALKGFKKTVPTVLASAWRAADRKVALVVASIADQPVSASLLINPASMGLISRGRFFVLEPTGAQPVALSAEALQLNLAPLEARVLEWRPDGR
jgi:hypothetical protein